MLSQDEFCPAQATPDLDVCSLGVRTGSFVKFLWHAVGEPWYWSDRSQWTDDDWHQLAKDDSTYIWVGYTNGAPAGYFELHRDGTDVEIRFFGLLPEFIGKGYGGHLLNEAVIQAWSLGTRRVWLHTCSWDGPHAVANYKARGFNQFDEKVTMEEVPAFDAKNASAACSSHELNT